MAADLQKWLHQGTLPLASTNARYPGSSSTEHSSQLQLYFTGEIIWLSYLTLWKIKYYLLNKWTSLDPGHGVTLISL